MAAIGTGTAKMLAEEGFKVAMQEDALTSRHFGNSLVPRFNQDDRALLIQGEMAGNMLQETLQQKCSTDKIVVYRTNELQLTRSDKDKLTSNAYLWALYTSPTGFKAYQKHVTNINQRKIACIGQTTAAYISRQGYKPQFIASNPNFETVAKELSNCMQFMVQHSTFTT
ncbi:MAG: uroporphyrinogen-III synthase [Bacteroidales bacterium]|nr:uroporphyrinogen-III synthase [Bacteroidales bacterium]